MLKVLVLNIAWAFFGVSAMGAVEVGTGISSTTGGRLVPTLSGSVNVSGAWIVTAFSAGVQNELYYQSGYGLQALKTWSSGRLWGGPVNSGFGLGLYYSARALQESTGIEEETSSDFVFGPAYRVQWVFADPVFLTMDATFGLKDLGLHLALTFQDVIHLSLGVQF